jgi:hypothetical protein
MGRLRVHWAFRQLQRTSPRRPTDPFAAHTYIVNGKGRFSRNAREYRIGEPRAHPRTSRALGSGSGSSSGGGDQWQQEHLLAAKDNFVPHTR